MRSTGESQTESLARLLLAKRARLSLITAFVLTLAIAPPIRAQVAAGITGVVADSSGAPIPAATVTTKNLETGALRNATSDATGRYLVLSLPVGQYEVRVTKAGFKESVRSGIQLAIDQEARVDLNLQIALISCSHSIPASSISRG